MNQLTIFSVATDRYLEFWVDLVNSAEQFLAKDLTVQWIIFTNRRSEIPQKLTAKLGRDLLIVDFASVPWPMPTLLRYELLASVKHNIEGEIIIHLDADMLFVGKVSRNDLIEAMGRNEVALVRHPGFYRPRKFAKIRFYFKHPVFIIRDIKLYLLNGGIGSWEMNSKSLAYVPRRKRNVYVCGGTWFGKKKSIIELCELLSCRTKADLANNVMAKFHDEGHINWYAANHQVSIADSKFCLEPSYSQLVGIKPLLIAIDKGRGANWNRD